MSRKQKYNCESLLIVKEIKSLKNYLKQKHLAENTIRQTCNYTIYFLQWTEIENLSIEEIKYIDLLSYISYCKKQGIGTRLINRKLLAIRHYYNHLKQINNTIKNPALQLYLKGNTSRIPHNLLNWEELEDLYEKYSATNERTQRNKVILGLLIYQGLATQDIMKLEESHLKIKEGKIYISGTKRSNGRLLKLEALQIIELYKYINTTRPQLLEKLKIIRERKKLKPINKVNYTDPLFISLKGSLTVKSGIEFLLKELRDINPKVIDTKQIRSSVITEWLKKEDIRQVQYKIGHKYVSSTQRYKIQNLEDLQKALNIYHPLGE